MKALGLQVPHTVTRQRIVEERAEALTMEEVDKARILAFAFVEAARIVEERAGFAEFATREIGEGEEDKVREMMRTAIAAKLKHAGLMVLLNTANKGKRGKPLVDLAQEGLDTFHHTMRFLSSDDPTK